MVYRSGLKQDQIYLKMNQILNTTGEREKKTNALENI